MAKGDSHIPPLNDLHQSGEKARQNETLLKKLHELTLEESPKIRRQLTYEVAREIAEMIQENNEMKGELIAFIKRLRGDL